MGHNTWTNNNARLIERYLLGEQVSNAKGRCDSAEILAGHLTEFTRCVRRRSADLLRNNL